MVRAIRLLTVLLTLLLSNLILGQDLKNDLMPVPYSVVYNSNKLRINESFSVALKGNTNHRINRVVTGFLERLERRTGITLPNVPVAVLKVSSDSARLSVSIERPGLLKFRENESYNLEVSNESVTIYSITEFGAMHALNTLQQLLNHDSEGYYFKGCKITDKPRFPWRGLMMDVSRHFMPVEVIKRNIDAMSLVKLNVLHWHLSDDQGFRVESKVFPKLHEKGSDGLYYTQNEVREVVQFAAERGIRIVPEFDVPGHSTSWLVAYPELGSAPGPYEIERRWGVFDPTMNPAKEFTYEFLDNFFGEMVTLFPDEYFHIGGDENNGKHWNENPEIQEFMVEKGLEDNHALQNYFNKRVSQILEKYDRTMVGWDEILHPDIPEKTVIHSWRGRESLISASSKGYDVMLSNGYYIDLNYPTVDHYLNDPAPVDENLSEEMLKHIIGGEATMWAEYVTPENVDSRIWSRTAAIAERFWSPANVNDITDMYRRLDKISLLLEDYGAQHITGKNRMIRRIICNDDPTCLVKFLNAIEPVKGYRRETLAQHYQYTPLVKLVDIATPDAIDARKLRMAVHAIEAGSGSLSEIEEIFKGWKENHNSLAKLINKYPILHEANQLAINLEKLAETGLELIDYLRNNKSVSESAKERIQKVLKECKTPYAILELPSVVDIEKLLVMVQQD